MHDVRLARQHLPKPGADLGTCFPERQEERLGNQSLVATDVQVIEEGVADVVEQRQARRRGQGDAGAGEYEEIPRSQNRSELPGKQLVIPPAVVERQPVPQAGQVLAPKEPQPRIMQGRGRRRVRFGR
jgi:hypothetical protein